MNYAVLDRLAMKQSDKNFARRQVRYALLKGRIKKESCACGDTKTQAHHADYSRPLDVMWVCRKHHEELDRVREALLSPGEESY